MVASEEEQWSNRNRTFELPDPIIMSWELLRYDCAFFSSILLNAVLASACSNGLACFCSECLGGFAFVLNRVCVFCWVGIDTKSKWVCSLRCGIIR